MMADGVFQASEATIVEKGWLQSGVTQRRGAKLIPILGQPSHLFQAKVFVGSGTIEGNIANSRRDLRHADHVLFEIAEHLRSEEHTSELQSPCNLVCRLLLEKKKNT